MQSTKTFSDYTDQMLTEIMCNANVNVQNGRDGEKVWGERIN